MARYMDIHTGMQGITEKQLREAHVADTKIEKKEGVHFLKAWADPKSGKVFCLSEAPTQEAVLRVHQQAGHATTEIYEVPLEIT